VVVAPNELPVSLGDAEPVRDQSHLVHGTELGRPDHQSLSMLLVTIAICAEWSHREANRPAERTVGHRERSRLGIGEFGILLNESLILLVLVMVFQLACHAIAQQRRVPGDKEAPHSGAAYSEISWCRGAMFCSNHCDCALDRASHPVVIDFAS